jgi:hypothetical protein
VIVSWCMVAFETHEDNEMPAGVLGLSTLLNCSSGLVFAVVMVGHQGCCQSKKDTPERFTDVNSTRKDLVMPHWKAPPQKHPVFVNTDIESSSLLWAHLGPVMQEAQDMHDALLRSLLPKHHGYEITTCGDAFQLAFHTIGDAISYALDVQLQLLELPWPRRLVESPHCATVYVPSSSLSCSSSAAAAAASVALSKASLPPHYHASSQGHRRNVFLFRGLRVRMGIHAADDADGPLFVQSHPVTGRITYAGTLLDSDCVLFTVSDIGNSLEMTLERIADMSTHKCLSWPARHE